jgi:hypothetical protein
MSHFLRRVSRYFTRPLRRPFYLPGSRRGSCRQGVRLGDDVLRGAACPFHRGHGAGHPYLITSVFPMGAALLGSLAPSRSSASISCQRIYPLEDLSAMPSPRATFGTDFSEER